MQNRGIFLQNWMLPGHKKGRFHPRDDTRVITRVITRVCTQVILGLTRKEKKKRKKYKKRKIWGTAFLGVTKQGGGGSELIVKDAALQVRTERGVLLALKELGNKVNVALVMKVAAQKVEHTLVKQAIGHLLRRLAIIAAKGKDIALELYAQILQMLISRQATAGIIVIALRMRHDQIPTLLLQLVADVIQIKERLGKTVFDEQIASAQRTKLTLGIAPLARLHHLQETLIQAVLKAVVLQFDGDMLLGCLTLEILEERFDLLWSVQEIRHGMMGAEDDSLYTESGKLLQILERKLRFRRAVIHSRDDMAVQLPLVWQGQNLTMAVEYEI